MMIPSHENWLLPVSSVPCSRSASPCVLSVLSVLNVPGKRGREGWVCYVLCGLTHVPT